MTPRQFSNLCAVTGWSNTQLGQRCGCSESTIRLLRAGTIAVPPEIATWIQRIAEVISAHPAPQWSEVGRRAKVGT